MKPLQSGIVGVFLGWASTLSAAPTVGIAFDEQCASCSVLPAPGVPLQVYVVLSGWSRGSHCIGCGLSGVDFRIDGIPADWSASYSPSPRASFASDPLSAGGAGIQFNPPLGDVPDCFVLYTLTLVPTATAAARISAVEHPLHNCRFAGTTFPQGPFWAECPIHGGGLLCSGECAPGGVAYTNGVPCHLTATQMNVWGRVKALYR